MSANAREKNGTLRGSVFLCRKANAVCGLLHDRLEAQTAGGWAIHIGYVQILQIHLHDGIIRHQHGTGAFVHIGSPAHDLGVGCHAVGLRREKTRQGEIGGGRRRDVFGIAQDTRIAFRQENGLAGKHDVGRINAAAPARVAIVGGNVRVDPENPQGLKDGVVPVITLRRSECAVKFRATIGVVQYLIGHIDTIRARRRDRDRLADIHVTTHMRHPAGFALIGDRGKALGGKATVVVGHKERHARADAAQARQVARRVGAHARHANDRDHDARKHGDNRYHGQQLDQREAGSAAAAGFIFEEGVHSMGCLLV